MHFWALCIHSHLGKTESLRVGRQLTCSIGSCDLIACTPKSDERSLCPVGNGQGERDSARCVRPGRLNRIAGTRVGVTSSRYERGLRGHVSARELLGILPGTTPR